MKISIGLVGYECAEHLETTLTPWAALKDQGHEVFISLIHGVFPETYSLGYPIDSQDGTWDLMKELKHRGRVDHVEKCQVPRSEFELRNLALQAARETGRSFDIHMLLDHDEVYEAAEIERLIGFVAQEPRVSCFRINFKNYVIRPGLYVDDFVAPRIWNYDLLDKFYYDNSVVFKNGKKVDERDGVLVPREIAFPKHYSWVGREAYLKRKIQFQKIHYKNCSYVWNEKDQCLEFNTEYYQSIGKALPTLHEEKHTPTSSIERVSGKRSKLSRLVKRVRRFPWLVELGQAWLIHGKPWRETLFRRKRRPVSSESVAEILVVQLADIGDLILTSVFLKELRRQFSRARITLVVAPHTAGLARSCPEVDQVETFDYQGLAPGQQWQTLHMGCLAWWEGAGRLWEGKTRSLPDLAFSVRDSQDGIQVASQMVMTCSGARWSVGYPLEPGEGRLGSTRLLDVAVTSRVQGHEVERQLHLLTMAGWTAQAAGDLSFWTTPDLEERAIQELNALGLDSKRPRVGLHVGAGHPLKRWPLASFGEVARWLEKEKGAQIIFVGCPADVKDSDRVMEDAGLQHGLNMAGKLPLEVTAVLLRHLHGYVGNDSGPLHLAVAAGIPVVGIYGPADSIRYGPWKRERAVVTLGLGCSPCPLNCSFVTNHCLQDLNVESVRQKIEENIFSERGRPG